ncbi:MAG TPA: PAS domain S-box protein [Roseiarcus sp.]
MIRSRDWSATPLGPIGAWPQSLTTSLGFLLHSPIPIVMLWGEEGIMLYNDAYSVFAGGRHPELLGSRVREGWPEVAAFNDNVMRVCLAGGTLAYRDQELTLYRHGYAEQVWMNLDYSPVFGEDGRPAGVVAIVVETTERVRAEERRNFLNDLGEALRTLHEPPALLATTAERLGRYLGVDRVGYGAVSGEAEMTELQIDAEWRAGGAPSIVGRHNIARFAEAFREDFLAGRSMVVKDFATDPRTAGAIAEEMAIFSIGAQIALPRYSAGRFAGVLFVQSATPRQWSDDEVLLVREVAERTWASAERAKAETALSASETRLRLGMLAGRMSTWELELATLRILRSDNADEIFGRGVTAEEFYSRVPSEDQVADRARFTAALNDPEVHYDSELRYQHPDGRWMWLHIQGRIVRDAAGRPYRAYGVCIDVTARKTAELELQRLNALLAKQVEARTKERDRLFELTSDLFAVAGFDGRFKIINPAWTKLLGRPAEEILATPYLELVHPEDRRPAEEVLGTLRAGGVIAGFEVRAHTADGKTVWIAWTAVPYEDSIYAVGRDVTREREREEAFRQSQKMEAVGQLTGGIAHDFNNLLGAVVGSFELIRRRADDVEKVRHWADLGIAAADRGAKLTSQLLAFSRSQKMELQPIVSSSLIEGMREMLTRTLGPMIALDFQLEGGGATVRSDPTQLEMAVLNLCLNARDAMAAGGEITVRTARVWLSHDPELPAGEYLELSVADKGAGMPVEVLGRALDPFFTTKPVGKGTGLGLSQVYGIARQGGGTVRLDSTPGLGTIARILLPIVAAEDFAEARTEADCALQRREGGTALIIDDDADMRRSLREFLEVLGYAVREAEDGEAGLALLERERPDVMIVDFAMPGLNGADVARSARKMFDDLPIVLVSGYSDTAIIEERIGDGAILIRKPFRIDALQRAIDEASAKIIV